MASRALIPFADGFEEIEAITIVDVLRRGGVTAVTAAVADSLTVTGAHGVPVKAEVFLRDVIDEEWDAIVLPGGGTGTENLAECEPLIERLRRQKSEGRLVCAICAAPIVLAKAEVLEGEHVTCYPTCVDMMPCPVMDVPAIADGLVITGQGPGSATVFALAVLANLEGEGVSEDVSAGMVVRM